jgi:hypothetical protein
MYTNSGQWAVRSEQWLLVGWVVGSWVNFPLEVVGHSLHFFEKVNLALKSGNRTTTDYK